MYIEKVYVTSKGTFWDRSEAEKRSNRKKDIDTRSPEYGKYEEVREEYVLVSDGIVFKLEKAVKIT